MTINPSLQCSELARVDALAHHRSVPTRSGKQVYWRRFGPEGGAANGTPLILLHGGHGSWAHWIRNVEALSVDRTVWVADMPGYGLSDTLDPENDLDLLVTTLGESIDTLVGADTPIDLAAFSFGGLVSSTLATRRKVRRLMLVGSGAHGGPRRPHEVLRNWRSAPDDATRTQTLDFNLYAFMLHARQPDDLGLCVHEMSCVLTRFRSKELSQSDRLTPLLGKSDAKKLLIWGDCDVTLADPQGISDALKRNGVDHTLELVAGAGHWAQFEKADEINALLLNWLK